MIEFDFILDIFTLLIEVHQFLRYFFFRKVEDKIIQVNITLLLHDTFKCTISEYTIFLMNKTRFHLSSNNTNSIVYN